MIAVPNHRFAHWIKFADGMSVRLRCDRDALDAWWSNVLARHARLAASEHQDGLRRVEMM
ncbi:hypothetical protein [Bradyrhizobium cenepequi]|uniref:hypothetical protein n=1 Tax=Bradyrhizobium cenepequi TaxID=2821403 RepID=UPI0035D98D98